MAQADVDDRFTLLCSEFAAACKGERGQINPQHALALRDRVLPLIVDARTANREHRPLTGGRVNEMWDLFTDITGIPEPA